MEEKLRDRDDQLKRNSERVARLQTKVSTFEHFKADR